MKKVLTFIAIVLLASTLQSQNIKIEYGLNAGLNYSNLINAEETIT